METLPLGRQHVSTIIEKAGLRSTPQRLAVYDHLSRSAVHPTAEDVYHSVRTQIPRISLATVYKALETLVSVGVATKLDPGPGGTRSRYDGRTDRHYHFRCLRTGAVHDLPTHFDPDLLGKLDPHLHEDLDRHGFEVTGYRLELIGYQKRPDNTGRNQNGSTAEAAMVPDANRCATDAEAAGSIGS